jgi:thiol:disulfide interchange protein DsbD
MNHSFFKRTTAFLAVFIALILRVNTCVAADFLDPEEAFKVKAELNNAQEVVLHWDIAKGYKLYRDRVKIGVESGKVQLQVPVLPKGIKVTDPSTNETVEIYHDQLTVVVPLAKDAGVFTLNVEYQGCAEDGLCYPPMNHLFKVEPNKQGILLSADDQAGKSANGAEKKAIAAPLTSSSLK